MLDYSSGKSGWHADALSEVLGDLRISDGTYGRCELTGSWGIDFRDVSQARFHFVVSGSCFLRSPERGWIELHVGDVVLVPHGTKHALAHKARGKLAPLEDIPLDEIGDRAYEMRAGTHGKATILVCCSVSFAAPAAASLLELMPPMLLIREGAAKDKTLPLLLDAMTEEVEARRVGAATVLTRLADVVITRIVRSWVESRTEDTVGWLAAIRDPQVGRALAAIHKEPGKPWSVESLADVAKTSRSVFAERFNAVVGIPPARYLTRWRMNLATGWLRSERLTVAETAMRLGYDSEAAFSRAFKRFVGVPPSAIRRAAVE
ncbi:Transcriptional regulator, AraC family [Labilithrix luteola]|uniref:Transcriptional regulator, AraC family n=1 Tax=Labilithrix luteola TaxID=1391654 RepID=A0A0K1Q1D8_9BACT|nr:AraC family transcriptional regulator [Labilithrix luteola]AKU99610.1 Transcriptional regulator, AraC family [Labilithrix luteola]